MVTTSKQNSKNLSVNPSTFKNFEYIMSSRKNLFFSIQNIFTSQAKKGWNSYRGIGLSHIIKREPDTLNDICFPIRPTPKI